MKFITFKRRCKLIHNRLDTINGHAKTLSALEELSMRQKEKALTLFEETKEKSKDYNTIKESLLNTPNSVEDEDEDELQDYDSKISDLVSEIISMLRPLLPPPPVDDSLNATHNSQESASATASNVRLPKIQLKSFNGDISQWIAFHNVFDVTVHQNKTLSDIDKFQYLHSCLQNQPYDLIKSLPLTNENYSIAYETLLKRYHNPRVLKSLHINHLIDMPTCQEHSAKQLRNFISQFREHSSALASLGVVVNEDNPILVTLLLRKFDVNFRTLFESKRKQSQSDNLPTPDEFIKFLEQECCHIENAYLTNNQPSAMRQSSQSFPTKNPRTKTATANPKNVAFTAHASDSDRCIYCKNEHIVYTCSDFSKLTPKDRYNFIKTNNCCANCLGSHKYKDCNSKIKCKKCNQKHHTLLHMGAEYPNQRPVGPKSQSRVAPAIGNNIECASGSTPSITPSTSSDVGDGAPVTPQSVHTVNVNTEAFTTLLGTTLVKLTTSSGNSTVVRGLIDSGSTCSFVNSDIVSKLQLKRQYCKTVSQVNGISATSVNIKGMTHADIFTLDDKNISRQHSFLILDKITADMPTARISPSVKNSLANFKLADPNFDKPGPIQMLIGADLFMQIIKNTKLSLGENMPYALDTVFGFVVIGKTPLINANQADATSSNLTSLVCIQDDPLHKLMTNFWLTEQPPNDTKLTDDEIFCENHFLNTHQRSPETGKFIVRLPFKDNHDKLGDSSLIAKKRFLKLENKLNSEPELKQLYSDFMDEYQNLGHMALLNNDAAMNSIHYFLPHHGVVKETSSTTRLRVVFDASCKTSTDVSLNEILHVGPKLHNDIATIITNFRIQQFVFTADIKQMFRSIELDKRDRPFQLIYWRKDTHDPLSVYQLNTVTYGMACSPYLANRVIKQLADEEKSSFPDASSALINQIYVDDLALGSDNLVAAKKLQHDVISLLNKGGFQLRKWSANHSELLTGIPVEFHEQPVQFRTPDQPLVGILGLQWIPNSDNFTYKINISDCSTTCTKRIVLSNIAKIFDPCGFLSPVVILSKQFIQTLWIKGLEWDSPLSPDLENKWLSFFRELPLLEKIAIPRYMRTPDATSTQLHGFSDASESAYAACIYLRTQDSTGNVKITIVMAKTRVAPLTRSSLPRLELCAAHLLAKLMNHCNNVFSKQIKLDSIHAWSDSTVTLGWISTPSHKLKTFVGNRVAQIQEWLPSAYWSHVPSAHNPADCASRGILPHQLVDHDLWWSGPRWLMLDQTKWPKTTHPVNIIDIPELKPSVNITLIAPAEQTIDDNILSKYSSWDKLRRIIAIILRFKHNAIRSNLKIRGSLSPSEIRFAENIICRIVQQNSFPSEIDALSKHKTCSDKIQQLSPFLDECKLIRVGGRLKNAKIDSDSKYPILLPKSHHITSLIVDFYHINYLHAGPQFLQSHLSKRFWIMSARSLIRSRVHKCHTCFRFKPPTMYPKMGDLPESRVNPSPCFNTTGLDYGGPFEVKIHMLRRAQVVKAYLCLFVCFSTKAIHIEVASDLSTDTFIAALRRFIARRGCPTNMYMDNATNFVGASNQTAAVIRNLLRNEGTKKELHKLNIQHEIKFHFIPPSAPHQGGIWESGIKSAKTLLKRTIGERILTLEEFQTLTTQVEAILNSRPLCPLSADPSELDFLSPGHFLIGRPMVSLPQTNYTDDMPINRLKRWQAVQAIVQRMWKRWQAEYLHTLQQRKKWNKDKPNINIGDLVLINETTTPPQTWAVGRVIATHPGADGVVRVVTLKTATGELKRPVVKISPFPN